MSGTASAAAVPERRLRVLLVEDNPDDAEFVMRELRHGGYTPYFKRVMTADDMRAALTTEQWDVIISDHSLPDFSAPEAFRLLGELNIDIPFIMVSGTVGEEIAVEAMRSGVHDFLLKGHLKRLVAAVEREIRDASVRADKKKIQEQLLISERMASMGTLAAGVAHEINNPLSVVAGNLHLIRDEVDALARDMEAREAASDGLVPRLRGLTAGLRESLRDAEEATARVRAIVRDLRVFSRPEDDTRDALDIHRVLESAVRMARNELRQRAKVVLELQPVPPIVGNEGRLGQVFLNLIVNAAHAIPEGRAAQNTITLRTRSEGRMVVIEVADTGTGIPPEVLPRIFDAFFTTKPIGVGTGLGLAICHRLLTAMDGRVEVDSQVGVGTTFRVYLPRARTGQTRECAVAAPPPPVTPPESKASVLVVEDESALGRVLARLLTPHRVTAVSRARDALTLIRRGERFDVVLCDLMMPEMTGMEFYGELATADPATARRVVFMTGGAFTSSARTFLESVPNVRLDKPLDTGRLRSLIDDMAGAPPAAASPQASPIVK